MRVLNRPVLRPFPLRPEEEIPIAEARLNGGMVTGIDTGDLENNQLAVAKNVEIRDDKTRRRYGTTIFAPAKPDALPILCLESVKSFADVVNILRFTTTSVNRVQWGGVAWTPIAGVALTSDDHVRVSLLQLGSADSLFFTNGVQTIMQINLAANTYAAAGNAPKAKFIAGFFNRLVAANYTAAGSVNPVEVGWSGDTNFTEFDPAVDYSAGYTFLAESPSDYSDFITGLFAFANSMVILKEKSVWLATKQPSASNPFNFFTAVPGIGCDAPMTAQKIPGGVVWYDSRTSQIYTYVVGETMPTPIGGKIIRYVSECVPDPNHLTSAYDPVNNEYSLVQVPQPFPSNGTSRIWKYNFITQAWCYDEIADVTNLSMVSDSTNVRNKMYGKVNGDILVDDFTYYNPAVRDTDNGTAFTTEIRSKTYEMERDNTYICRLRIEFIPKLAGTFTVQYSKDNGTNWTTYKNVTWVAGDVGKRKVATFSKNIQARQYTWRITSTSGLFEIIEYEARAFRAGISKQG